MFGFPKMCEMRTEMLVNRSVDTDVLSAGVASLLSAGHFQR